MSDAAHTLEAGDLQAMLASGDAAAAAARYQTADLDPAETRVLFTTLDAAEGAALLAAMPDGAKAREVLLWLPVEQAGALAGRLDPVRAAGLLGGLPSDERADVLAAVPDDLQAAIQAKLAPEARADAARLLAYPPDTAGGLMETELLAYPASATVADAIRDLRANRDRYSAVGVQYIYLKGDAGRLVGVVPIRDMMLAAEDARLEALIKGQPVVVRDTATTQDLALVFDEHPYMAIPVVSESGALLGLVNRADVGESEQHQTEEQYRRSLGIVGGEELRSMPVAPRLGRRTAWLGVNLILCLAGAAVIAANQDTLVGAIVVAAVLPVVSATSGNAAMQAAAVSIRELTLGVIEPAAWRRVLVHELFLGLLMAAPLGIALALLSRAWGASWGIGAAVGIAMALNTCLALAIGALAPLVLRRLKVDPALASGPIATTLTDVTGFALTLTLVAQLAG